MDLVLVALAKLAPHHLIALSTLFSPSRGRVGLHYVAVEPSNAPSSLSKVDAIERKPRAVVAACARAHDLQRLFKLCCRRLACHRHWASIGSRISFARSALLASVSRQRNRVAPRPRPPGFRIRVGFRFRSERCGDRNGMDRALPPGSLLYYFFQLIRQVSLLVLLLVSAAIDDESYFKFR